MIVKKTNWAGSGKVGLNYFRTVHGVNISCAMPVFAKDPTKSAAQMDQQEKFSTLGKLASAFLSAIKIGLKNVAKQLGPLVSPFDAFVKINNGSVSVMGGEAEIDYASVKISKGSLEQCGFQNASFATPQTVKVEYSTAISGNGDAQDKIYLVAYSPDLKYAMMAPAALRTTGNTTLNFPASWTGLTVHVFGFVQGDGRENKGMLSESSYVGSGIVG